MSYGFQVRRGDNTVSISEDFPSYQRVEVITNPTMTQYETRITFAQAYDEQPLVFLRYCTTTINNTQYSIFDAIIRWVRDNNGKYTGVWLLNVYTPTSGQSRVYDIYAKVKNTISDGDTYGMNMFDGSGNKIFTSTLKPLRISYLAKVSHSNYHETLTSIFGTKPSINDGSSCLLNMFHSGLTSAELQYQSGTSYSLHFCVDGTGSYGTIPLESIDSDTGSALDKTWETFIICAKY